MEPELHGFTRRRTVLATSSSAMACTRPSRISSRRRSASVAQSPRNSSSAKGSRLSTIRSASEARVEAGRARTASVNSSTEMAMPQRYTLVLQGTTRRDRLGRPQVWTEGAGAQIRTRRCSDSGRSYDPDARPVVPQRRQHSHVARSPNVRDHPRGPSGQPSLSQDTSTLWPRRLKYTLESATPSTARRNA